MFIEIKELSKFYNTSLAVNKISFEVNKNKTLGLLGPNGCGKTTTIGMILGLVSPSEGEILIENKNINKLKRDEILQRFNFASPYVELPKKLTVKQNLEIYGRLYGVENLNYRIEEISNDLDIFLIKKLVSYPLDRKIEFLWQNLLLINQKSCF